MLFEVKVGREEMDDAVVREIQERACEDGETLPHNNVGNSGEALYVLALIAAFVAFIIFFV